MEGKRLERGWATKACAPWPTAGCGASPASTCPPWAFVEDLIAQRGQGGVNDLLRAMARDRELRRGLPRVYGKSLADLQQDRTRRLRQRYGR